MVFDTDFDAVSERFAGREPYDNGDKEIAKDCFFCYIRGSEPSEIVERGWGKFSAVFGEVGRRFAVGLGSFDSTSAAERSQWQRTSPLKYYKPRDNL